jgi:hypothetical protein
MAYVIEQVERDSLRVLLAGYSEPLHVDVVTNGGGRPDEAALLRIRDVPDGVLLPEPASFAEFSGEESRECEATVYPENLNRGKELPVAMRLLGPAEALAGNSRITFTNRRPAIAAEGLGGSGLLHEGRLLGIFAQASQDGEIILVEPIKQILKSPQIAAAMEREFGRPPSIKIVEPPPKPSVRSALSEVSNADPNNIQEVAAGTLALNNLYYENVLAQARSSFLAAVVTATIGTVFFLGAVALAITTDRVAPSAIGALGGAIVSAISGLNFWLYGKTSRQLESFHLRLERMQRYLVANSVSSALTVDQRDTALTQLIASLSSEVSTP